MESVLVADGSGEARPSVLLIPTVMGVTDLDRVYTLEELAKGDVMFAATGVTDGTMLEGVRRVPGGLVTHSIVMRSKTGTVRLIHCEHSLARKSGVVPHFHG